MARCLSKIFLATRCSKLSTCTKSVGGKIFSFRHLSQLSPLIVSAIIVTGAYLVFTSAASRLTCEQQLRRSLKESMFRLQRMAVHAQDERLPPQTNPSQVHEEPPENDTHEEEPVLVEQYIRNATAIEDVPALRPESEAVVNDVTLSEYSLNKEECALANENRTLFIAILSAATNSSAKRESIRETWLKQVVNHAAAEGLGVVGVRFVVASPQDASVQERLEEENNKHNDILLVDVTKTSGISNELALLNWVQNYCSNVTFLLKLQDHVFVNTRVLVQTLARIDDNGPIVYGRVRPDLVSKEDSKLGRDEWPWKCYPSHLPELITIMTRESIPATLAASQVVPPLSLDGAYITLCAEKDETILMVSDRMTAMSGVNDFPDPCQLRSSLAWLTRSVEHYSTSHIAAENFYNGRTRCISTGSQLAADPSEVVPISFNSTQQ